MAKVTITLEDIGGKVRTVCNPSFETMMKKINSGEDLTSAEAYAIAALRRLLEASKEQGPAKVWVPRAEKL